MLHKFELPFESEILALEDDPALFDADPEWVGDLERPTREEDEYDGIGIRSVIQHPEALSKAWKRTTERRRNRFRAA